MQPDLYEVDSWEVCTPALEAALAAGALRVRDVRLPRIDEGQDVGCTALGYPVPTWARPGAVVLARVRGATAATRARVRSVGEGLVVLEWEGGGVAAVPWAECDPYSPAVAP